jgi:hypothetical protein
MWHGLPVSSNAVASLLQMCALIAQLSTTMVMGAMSVKPFHMLFAWLLHFIPFDEPEPHKCCTETSELQE